LERALAAHEAATAAVISESSKRTCSRTCIAALEQQAAEATAEVKAARHEIDVARADADREVSEARAALAALPVARGADTLAAILGWPGWALDIAAAGLAAISVNMLGALFIAFGAHGPKTSPPIFQAEPTVTADQQAIQFMVDRLRWSRDTRTPVSKIGEAYSAWANAKGLPALPPSVIAPRLSGLFDDAGVPVTDIDGARVAIGIALRSQELEKAV
jgi:hypothetical protein